MQMATRALAGLCLAAIVAAGPAPVRAQEQDQPQRQGKSGGQRGDQPRSPFFWWKDPAVQKELALNPQQTEKIESIWRAGFPSLKEMHTEMIALEKELSRLIRENSADENLFALQLDKVEARRSVLNKARTLILYRMHRVLTPDQYEGLTRIEERRKKTPSGRR